MKAVGYQKIAADHRCEVAGRYRAAEAGADGPRPAGEGPGGLGQSRSTPRCACAPSRRPGDWQVLGWDAAGVVEAAGPEAKLFKAGDEVFYAGAINRPGTNAEFHLVDERIVGPKPRSLSIAEAAALPLTAITAWEMLFDRLDVKKAGAGRRERDPDHRRGRRRRLDRDPARPRADRPDRHRHRLAAGDAAWVKQLGAHHVVDHAKPLAAEVAKLGIGAPAFVFSTTQTDEHLDRDRRADRAAGPLRR